MNEIELPPLAAKPYAAALAATTLRVLGYTDSATLLPLVDVLGSPMIGVRHAQAALAIVDDAFRPAPERWLSHCTSAADLKARIAEALAGGGDDRAQRLRFALEADELESVVAAYSWFLRDQGAIH